jgi:regulator of replication initiation timing
MSKRIKVRGDDVKRIVDLLVDEATEQVGEHLYMLDNLRAECERLVHENRTLRAELHGLRKRESNQPVDNG